MKIDFGIEAVKCQLGNSDKYIYFYPTDANFPERLEEAYDEIEKYASGLKEVEGIEAKIKQNREIDEFVKAKIDYAFGYPVSETAFGCVSALSLDADGFYLFEKFINAILPVIEKEFGKRFEKLNKRVKSYTDKKGMHPALKK